MFSCDWIFDGNLMLSKCHINSKFIEKPKDETNNKYR